MWIRFVVLSDVVRVCVGLLAEVRFLSYPGPCSDFIFSIGSVYSV